jgi:hypothetical protein
VTRWPAPEYRIEMEFDVPRDFAFAWCTDYRPDDARRAGDRYERRIVERAPNRVVVEDLWWQREGWGWRRSHIALSPPGHWRADSYGSFRDARIDYRLTPLPGDRTRFVLTMRRRPSGGHPTQPTKKALESELVFMWTRFGRAMAKDYRAARGAGPPRRRRRR